MNINNSLIFSYNQIKTNSNLYLKDTAKISSGYKINNASDDAAGLAISSKMRAQIRSLEKVENNLQDAISLVQTADGAIGEYNNMLIRIRELLVYSANDTNESTDRLKIQDEVDQLLNEIDDLVERTEFNKIKLLKGPYVIDSDGNISNGGNNVFGGMPEWVTMTEGGYLTTGDFTVNHPTNGNTNYTNTAYAIVDFSNLNASNINDLIGDGFYHTCCTCSQKYSFRFNNLGNNELWRDDRNNVIIDIDISGIASGSDLVQRIIDVAGSKLDHFTKVDVYKDDETGSTLILYDERQGQTSSVNGEEGIFDAGVWIERDEMGSLLHIQAGANSLDSMFLYLPNMTRERLNIDFINATSREASTSSLEKIDDAIDFVNKQRSKLGAYNNRLKHNLSHSQNYFENLSASESRIRDTDMAKSTMDFIKHDLLGKSSSMVFKMAMGNNRDLLHQLLM